jgi:hypothetical protein
MSPRVARVDALSAIVTRQGILGGRAELDPVRDYGMLSQRDVKLAYDLASKTSLCAKTADPLLRIVNLNLNQT